jgi:predicted nuclease with RNAse H fold
MKTLGVDLSANPVKTAACEIDWDAGDVRACPRRLSDAELVQLIKGVDKVGVDAPFGWPDGFVDAVAAHHRHDPWPGRGQPAPDYRKLLRFRLTDRVVASAGVRPLSVSSDRIGVTAMRCADLQDRLSQDGEAVDRAGLKGRVTEVYPAAALHSWGLPWNGYKGPGHRAAREALADLVFLDCWSPAAALRVVCGGDDDELDAFLCAVIAKAVYDGNTVAPSTEQLAQARREGWIHIPTVALNELWSL